MEKPKKSKADRRRDKEIVELNHKKVNEDAFSIALSLFVTNSISIQRVSSIADCDVNDFIHFLKSNQIPWSFGEEDGHKEYQKGIDDLLIKIDQMFEDEKTDQFLKQ